MAVSLDTYDAESQLHPRNKQLPSKRLATAGLNVAYGLDQFPTKGPFPTLIDFTLLSEGIQVDILYDQSFTWDPSETSGFYFCLQSECDWRGWEKVCASQQARKFKKVQTKKLVKSSFKLFIS